MLANGPRDRLRWLAILCRPIADWRLVRLGRKFGSLRSSAIQQACKLRLGLDHLQHPGQGGFEAKPLLDLFRQHAPRTLLAMREDHAGFAGRDGAKPSEEVSLPSVGAKAAECMNF